MYISSDESNDALNDVFSDYEEDVNENVDDESDINSVCEEEDADDEERRNFSIYLLQFFLENGISNVKSDQFLKKLYTFDFIKKLKLNKSTKALSNYVKKKIRYNPPIGEYVSVKSTIENIIKKCLMIIFLTNNTTIFIHQQTFKKLTKWIKTNIITICALNCLSMVLK